MKCPFEQRNSRTCYWKLWTRSGVHVFHKNRTIRFLIHCLWFQFYYSIETIKKGSSCWYYIGKLKTSIFQSMKVIPSLPYCGRAAAHKKTNFRLNCFLLIFAIRLFFFWVQIYFLIFWSCKKPYFVNMNGFHHASKNEFVPSQHPHKYTKRKNPAAKLIWSV